MICTVTIKWDAEVGVYVATSADVPGLVTEHESAEVLMGNVVNLIPDLLDMNGRAPVDRVRFEIERVFPVVAAAA